MLTYCPPVIHKKLSTFGRTSFHPINIVFGGIESKIFFKKVPAKSPELQKPCKIGVAVSATLPYPAAAGHFQEMNRFALPVFAAYMSETISRTALSMPTMAALDIMEWPIFSSSILSMSATGETFW